MTSPKDKLVVPFSLSILGVWIATAVYGIFSGQYAPLTVTTPVMLLAAGYVFGVNLVRRSDDH